MKSKVFYMIIFISIFVLFFIGCKSSPDSGVSPSSSTQSISGYVVVNSSETGLAAASFPRSFLAPVAALVSIAADPTYIAIPNADIVLTNGVQTYTTTSDTNGYFEITGVPLGVYTIKISKINTTVSPNTKYWYVQEVNIQNSVNLANVYIHKNPAVINIYINGTKISSTINEYKTYVNSGQLNVNVGDTLTIKIEGEDPNSSPLEYRFITARNSSLASVLADWNGSNQISYTFVSEDVVNSFVINSYVRNGDGVEANGTNLGDTTCSLSFNVSNAAQSPAVSSIEVLQNGVATSNRNFNVGDTVTVRVNASDPNSLPLQYKFFSVRNSSVAAVLADWNGTNEITYTFVSADAVSNFSINAYVKNNDGVEANGTNLGDTSTSVSFTVNNGTQSPTISSVEVLQNGVVTSNRNFSVGDTITIRVNATDPQSLPLEYRFISARNSTLAAVLADWNGTNEITYTFVSADVVTSFVINAYVRNNDGVEVNGTNLGDTSSSLSFNVNDF